MEKNIKMSVGKNRDFSFFFKNLTWISYNNHNKNQIYFRQAKTLKEKYGQRITAKKRNENKTQKKNVGKWHSIKHSIAVRA